MSIRMTYDWALYEIASKIEDWERLCKVQFTLEEKECLGHYLSIYKKQLDLHKQIRELKQQLPPHPQINEVTKAYKELCQESDRIEEEINRLVESAPLQNVLSYRFHRKPQQQQKQAIIEEAKIPEQPKQKDTIKQTLISQRIAAIISIVLCAVLYLSFLSAFTTKRETYICYTTKTGTHYHSAICKYLNTAYETTVYEASRKYKPCEYCNPCVEQYKTTITDRNYIIPILISVPISAAVFLLLTYKKKK